ncbi:PilZ domain-containing protein [Geomesophilobacter sediminis]|uniref:PilZ domain-containing protein n=1 Tax=Geomesophilobacter sediminis TaxID=2798584 RepID=A0A8J7LTG4_9BACT|nr:PilZ domain-containing protein [Geomesophilobacter sediminis]MBJ6723389.1 PilZ domain-containing protein [Geomesophilobacter sediminis]
MESSHRSKPLLLLYAPERALGGGKGVGRRYLVGRLNFLNFSGGRVLVAARAASGTVLLPALPRPCAGEFLELTWAPRAGLPELLDTHHLDELLVPDGGSLLLVRAEPVACDARGATLRLPENCRSCRGRDSRRERGERITACCSQEGARFCGRLADFSAEGVRVEGDAGATSFNPEFPVHLMLDQGGELVFSADCRLLRATPGILVLRLERKRVIPFAPARHREPRFSLSPPPTVTFSHPLTGGPVTWVVEELSATGFTVRAGADDPLLVPGLRCAEVGIGFGAFPAITCRAQIVSRGKSPDGRGIRCAFAILDLPPREQERLLALLPQEGAATFTEHELDAGALWELLFDTGFLYPEKYLLLAKDRRAVQETFRRLYAGHPEILRCFTCRDATGLVGHLAMLRLFRETWLIHHHAARRSLALGAGLAVLNRAAHHINALYRLPSAHLQYVCCYFRPDNKLPNRVFGGAARHLRDPSRCSLDRFAYGIYQRTAAGGALPAGWDLQRAGEGDLERLVEFYREQSGGLFPVAFDLFGRQGEAELARSYRRAGLKRKRRFFALRRDGRTVAFALALQGDRGLNLSELTDCVTLFVLEPLPEPVGDTVLALLSGTYREHRMPVLVYPHRYGAKLPLGQLKEYLLWILDLTHADLYLDFFSQLVRDPRKGRVPPEQAEPPWETTG